MKGGKADIAKVMKRLRAEQTRLAQVRDGLRDLMADVEELESSGDEALSYLSDAIDALSRFV